MLYNMTGQQILDVCNKVGDSFNLPEHYEIRIIVDGDRMLVHQIHLDNNMTVLTTDLFEVDVALDEEVEILVTWKGPEQVYERIATVEEFKNLTPKEQFDLAQKAKIAPICVDKDTFEPYKVVDGVRYNIEPVQDAMVIEEK